MAWFIFLYLHWCLPVSSLPICWVLWFLWTFLPMSTAPYKLIYNAGCTAYALLQVTEYVFKWSQHQPSGRSHSWLFFYHEKWPISPILCLVPFNWFSRRHFSQFQIRFFNKALTKNFYPCAFSDTIIALSKICEHKFLFIQVLQLSWMTMFTLALSKLPLYCRLDHPVRIGNCSLVCSSVFPLDSPFYRWQLCGQSISPLIQRQSIMIGKGTLLSSSATSHLISFKALW